VSSPNDVIEFVIVGGKQKAPADGLRYLSEAGLVILYQLD
jgi:hypothetical protein